MNEVTEVVVVSWWSAAEIEALVANLRACAADGLRFLVIDNSGGQDTELAALAARADLRLEPWHPPPGGGSPAHASALGRGVDLASADWLLLCDPDVHVFLQAWDRLLRDAAGPRTAAVGAPYPWWKLGKAHDFPGPFFLLARRADLDALGNDWRPFAATAWRRGLDRLGRNLLRLGGLATRRRLLARPGLARVARRLEALLGERGPDTGHRLAAAARRGGRPSVLLREVEPAAAAARWGADSAFAELAAHFELFSFRGRPAVVHRYSSGARPWRTAGGGDDALWRRAVAAAEAELAAAGDGA